MVTQTEILIYITVLQWTIAIFGGIFLTPGTVVEGVDMTVRAVTPDLITFLWDTLSFFARAFVFDVPGAALLSPLWILMSLVWLVLFANFLRTGLS